MNEYEELIYSLIYNCKRKISKEEMQILNQASAIYNTYNKLTKQIGCPLHVVFKAVLRWIYYEDTSGNITRDYVDLHTTLDGEYVLLCNNSEKVFFTKDHKKTWFLKKDKSE